MTCLTKISTCLDTKLKMSEDIKTAVEGIAVAFEEFKATNDARLAEIEKKGASDPLVDEKLKNIAGKIKVPSAF